MKLARLLATGVDIAAIAAIGYTAVAIVCMARFGRRKPKPQTVDELPGVTLLVPLHGAEPGLEENLRAFASQDYPVCQLILGVARDDDSALAIARRVAAALPDRHIDINVGEVPGARNPKIANVLSMMRLVRHKVLILADSDTRVNASYVGSVAAGLREPGVGVVTAVTDTVSHRLTVSCEKNLRPRRRAPVRVGDWCIGNTVVSKTATPGSIPGSPVVSAVGFLSHLRTMLGWPYRGAAFRLVSSDRSAHVVPPRSWVPWWCATRRRGQLRGGR